MGMPVTEASSPVRITATGTVKSGQGKLNGFWVSSFTGGVTLTVYDGISAAGTTIINTWVIAGTGWWACPWTIQTGVHAVLSGAADITFGVE